MSYVPQIGGLDRVGSAPVAGGVASDPIWTAAGDLAVGAGAGLATVLSIGNAGEILQIVGGTPDWVSLATAGILVSGGALGTPSSGNLSSCTGYLVSNLSGLATGVATTLANSLIGLQIGVSQTVYAG